jgi:flagellar operon protein TIGR03826
MNLNIANCPRCGKIFARGISDVCATCKREVEEEYLRCVEYLRDNRGASIHELSEATGVSIRQITKFIREGRFALINAPNLGYPCESCGNPIQSGNLCEECRKKFAREARKIQQQLESRREKEQPRPQWSGPAYRIKTDKDPKL